MKKALLPAILLCLVARPLAAAIVYDAGSFTADGGAMASDISSSIFQQGPGAQRADEVRLLNRTQITGVNWWGQYAFSNTPQGPDDFTLQIFPDAGGNPADDPLNQFLLGSVPRIDTSVDSFGSRVYSYSAAFASPLILEPGTTYWLSIYNNTAQDADDNWYWQRVTRFSGVVQGRLLIPDSSWSGDVGIVAFNLEGVVVPEPTSLQIVLLAAAALSLTARKDRQPRPK